MGILMYKKRLSILRLGSLCGLLLILASCDSLTLTDQESNPDSYLTNLSVQPGDIQFDRARDGIKDTTIIYRVRVQSLSGKPLLSAPQYMLIDTDLNKTLKTGSMTTFTASTATYETSFTLQTNTSLFKNVELVVYALSGSQQLGNRIVRKLSLSGVPGIKPVIADARITPATVTIPGSGQAPKPILFQADVRDADGLDNIAQVYMTIRSLVNGNIVATRTLKLLSSSSSMRTYADTLQVASTNNPDRYRIAFFADDKSGLRSDSLFKELEFIR